MQVVGMDDELSRSVLYSGRTGEAVARVDSVLGDGRRRPMTFLLACDQALSRSCIEVHVEPAIPHPRKSIESLYELIGAIAHSP